MSQTPPSRTKSVLVIIMILLPLAITAIVKYRPEFTGQPTVASLAILHPRLLVPDEFKYLDEDVVKRMRELLADIRGVTLKETPPGADTPVGADLAKAAKAVQAEALLVSTVTIDSGLVQLNLLVVEPQSGRLLFNTPYQSSVDRYPDMMRAAAAAVKRTLERNN